MQSQQKIALIEVVLATFLFASQDAITRALSQTFPVHQFISVRMVAFFAAAILWAYFRGRLQTVHRSSAPFIQIARSLLWVLELMVFAWALRYLELANAQALFITFPLIVTVLAVPFLGETVGWRRGLSVVVGLVGALIIIQPWQTTLSNASWIAVLAAFMFAAYQLLTRKMSGVDGVETTVFYMGLVGVIVAPLFSLAEPWQPVDLVSGLWMALLCVTGIIGHGLLVDALSRADASFIQPFNFLSLFFAIPVGYLAFGEVPSAATIVGGLLIVGSGLFVVFRERAKRSANEDN
ncbi:MAG: DMT family transporter [Gammaproteobacteria bacterium]|nr:DMT family transporter [Gammaproteobacteria bacterium]